MNEKKISIFHRTKKKDLEKGNRVNFSIKNSCRNHYYTHTRYALIYDPENHNIPFLPYITTKAKHPFKQKFQITENIVVLYISLTFSLIQNLFIIKGQSFLK